MNKKERKKKREDRWDAVGPLDSLARCRLASNCHVSAGRAREYGRSDLVSQRRVFLADDRLRSAFDIKSRLAYFS